MISSKQYWEFSAKHDTHNQSIYSICQKILSKCLFLTMGKANSKEDKSMNLPTEKMKKILNYLDLKTLCSDRETCKHLKEVIDEF